MQRLRTVWLGLLGVAVACGGAEEQPSSAAGGGGSAGAGGNTGGSAGASTGGTAGVAPKPALDVGVVSASSGSSRESESTVTASSDGRVVAAWIGFGSGEPAHIGYAISLDAGATWQAPERVFAPNGGDSADPALATDAQGNVYLSWLEFNVLPTGGEGPSHVWLARSLAGSTGFETPVLASDGKTDVIVDKPWLTVTGAGQVLVAYMRQTGAFGKTTSLIAARSTGGTSFERSVVVDEGTVVHHDPNPCAGPSGSRVWLAHVWYQGSITTARHIALRYSDDGGASWPEANQVAISEESEIDVGFDDPRCVSDGQSAWISYGLSHDTPSASSFGTLYAMRLVQVGADGTVVRRTTVAEDSGKLLFLHPQLARDADGALLLAYYAGDAENDANGSVRSLRSTDGGVSFGPSRVLHQPVVFLSSRTSPRWIGEYFGAAAVGRDLYGAYVDNAASVSHIGFARVPSE